MEATFEEVQEALVKFLGSNKSDAVQVSKREDNGEAVRYLVSVGADTYIMEWLTQHDLILVYELQQCSLVVNSTLHRFNRVGSMVNVYEVANAGGVVEVKKVNTKQYVFNEVNTLL